MSREAHVRFCEGLRVKFPRPTRLRKEPKVKTGTKFAFIEEHPEYAVTKWAKMLKVSLSGYHTYRSRKEAKEKVEEAYRNKIKEHFEEGRRTYGVDRICGLLRKNGYKASYGRIKRLMDEMGFVSIHRRRRQRSLTDSRKARGNGYLNLTKGLKITEPFQVISSDISYIRTDEGFGYTCQIRDVVSNVVLAESMDDNMRSDLGADTIKQAMNRWHLPEGTIFHSDRGSQYTSEVVMSLLKKYGLEQSFSRIGMPGDNAWSESFFANLKKEQVHWWHFNTIGEARQVLFEYIEVFYNRQRVQKRLGYLSPIQWLKQWQKQGSKLVA
jgi:putative transposase